MRWCSAKKKCQTWEHVKGSRKYTKHDFHICLSAENYGSRQEYATSPALSQSMACAIILNAGVHGPWWDKEQVVECSLCLCVNSPVVVRQDNMDTRAGLADVLDCFVAQGADAVCVGTSGVDHTLGLDIPFPTCHAVPDTSPHHLLLSLFINVLQQIDNFCVVCARCTISYCCYCQRDVHASIIMLTCGQTILRARSAQSIVKNFTHSIQWILNSQNHCF